MYLLCYNEVNKCIPEILIRGVIKAVKALGFISGSFQNERRSVRETTQNAAEDLLGLNMIITIL